MATGFEYAGICPACGAKTRRPFAKGSGNKAKRQQPKWWVCDKGHRTYRKASQ